MVVADVLDKEGEAVVAEIRKAGGTATYVHLDVTSEAEWQAAVDRTVATHGGLHVLVNNAGISGSAAEDLYDTAIWHRLMDINSTGVSRHEVRGCRHPQDRRAGFGHQPVLDLRHRRPRLHPCRLQRSKGARSG